MIKQKFIELVRAELVGGLPNIDSLSKYPTRTLEHRISVVYDRVLLELYQASKRQLNFRVFDSLAKTFIVDILKDSVRGEYYSTLPSGIASFPNYVAIRQISPKKSPQVVYDIIPAGGLSVFAGDVSNRINDRPSVYVEGQKIYYWQLDSDTLMSATKEARIKMVVPFTEWAMEDDIPEPQSMQGTLFDIVVSGLRGTQAMPQDQVSDNKNIEPTK